MFYVNSRAIIERTDKRITEIVVQTRVKPGEPPSLELPGGQVEPFESLTQALIREVKEETGLDVIEIEGMETRIDTTGLNSDFEVECIQPFAAYQTIKGPVDSVGFYFRCKTQGELLVSGDHTENCRWISTEELLHLFQADPLQFSAVDRAGIQYYFNRLGLL